MKILVTGAEGFVGGYLVAHLRSSGHEVVTTGRDGDVDEHLELPNDDAAREVFEKHNPDAVVHLAALAAVPVAERQPELAYRINVTGTISVVEGMLSACPACKLLFVSSSNVYGPVQPALQPITEATGCTPNNVYAWTKLAAESWIQSQRSRFASEPIIVRPFNHVGPGQAPVYALSSFAKQVAAIERGQQEPVVRVGNLKVRRDMLDVADVVDAYRRLLETPAAGGIYNVCSANGYVLADLLDQLVAMSEVPVTVETDPSRLRANDLEVLVGSSARLYEECGWRSNTPIESTLRAILDDWRQRTKTEKTA